MKSALGRLETIALLVAVSASCVLGCSKSKSSTQGVGDAQSTAVSSAALGNDAASVSNEKCQTCVNEKCKGAESCEGGGFTPEQTAQCKEVLECVKASGCNSGGFSLFCYCGASSQEECDQGKGIGACKQLIEKGQKAKGAKAVHDNFFALDAPSGRAMAHVDCSTTACAKLCR
jgi:hypothetical protein